MASGPISWWQIEGEKFEAVIDFIFLGFKITAGSDCSHEIKRHLLLEKESYDKTRKYIKKQRHRFVNKGPTSQSSDFCSSHIRMWELDHTEGWVPKNWCFQIVVLEKTLESPINCKEIKPANSKGNQSWVFIRRTDAEAEAPVLWPPDLKSQLTGKDSDAGELLTKSVWEGGDTLLTIRDG